MFHYTQGTAIRDRIQVQLMKGNSGELTYDDDDNDDVYYFDDDDDDDDLGDEYYYDYSAEEEEYSDGVDAEPSSQWSLLFV